MSPATDDPTLAGRIFGGRRQPQGQPPGIEAENRALWTLVEELSTQLSREAARRVRLESLLAHASGARASTVGSAPESVANPASVAVASNPSAGAVEEALRALDGEGVSSLDGDEAERAESAAFDRFFATPDPDLDQTRRFLLD